MSARLSLEEALNRLDSGEAIESLIRSTAPTEEQEALKRFAVVRFVDREVAREVLLASEEASDRVFDELISGGLFESIPNSPMFRLKAGIRTDVFRSWWSDNRAGSFHQGSIPHDLRDLSANLVSYYERVDRPVDVFYHLVLADPERAVTRFKDLYRKADEGFDLAACQELIAALGDPDRAPLLSPDLSELLFERQVYLRARGDASIDYYRTASFLEPAGMREQFDKLIDGTEARLLELHAQGGMGKTMRLRWLQARFCVPKRIPCVRIDFDVIDPINASRLPWLVMLEVAELLNNQVPGSPFDLGPTYGAYRSLLRPGSDSDAKAVSLILKDPVFRERARIDVTNAFVGTLADSVDGPVILVLDTLEELVTRPGANSDGFVAVFQDLKARADNLRLIFAGRNDLTTQIRGFTEGFGEALSYAVEPFTDDEARRYLRDVRGIDDRDKVDVIVHKARGVPLVLALFADAVIARPDLEADVLQDYVGPDLVWLIERVIARIRETPIRWLVRYGFIPRRLTLDFARAVMLPHLGEGMPRPSRFDNPAIDALPEKVRRKGVFEHSDEKPDIEELWAGLRRYASRSSWVTEEPGDALVFHPNVREPMRELMRKHRTAYQVLQKDSIAYFEQRAKAEPDLWAMWMREAIYHMFMLRGPKAGPYWHSVLERALKSGSDEAALTIATAVLDPELSDDATGQSVRRGAKQTAQVYKETLIWANFEAAEILVRRAKAAGVGGTHPDWTDARKRFDLAQRMQRRRRIVPAARRGLVEGELLKSEGNANKAGQVLRRARSRARSASERADLDLALAEVWTTGRSGSLTTTIYASLLPFTSQMLRATHQFLRPRLLPVYRSMVEAALSVDRFEDALKFCEKGLREAHKVDAREVLLFRIQHSEVIARTGEPTRALADLESMDAGAARIDVVRHATGMARAAVAGRRPSTALTWLDQAPPLTATDADTAQVIAEALKARAAALAALLRSPSEVAAAFEGAASAMTSAGDVAGALRCHVASVDHAIREVGDLRNAKSLLERAELLAPKEMTEEWVRLRLSWAEFHDRRGDGAEAKRLVDATIRKLGRDAAPHLLVAVALHGLALTSHPAPADYVELLLENLTRVHPRRARAAMLTRLDRIPNLDGSVDAGLLRRMSRVIPNPQHEFAGRKPRLEDALLLGLARLELARISGDRTAHVDAVARIGEDVVKGDAPLLVRRWIHLALSYGDRELALRTPAAVRVLADRLPQEPGLVGAVAVAVAERFASDRAADGEVADELLQLASAALSASSPSQWLARLHTSLGYRAQVANLPIVAEGRFRTASSVYEALGELREAHDANAAIENQSFIQRDVASEITITLESGAAPLSIVQSGGPEPVDRSWSLEDAPPILAAFQPDGPSGDLVSNGFIRRLATEANRVGVELGQLLELSDIVDRSTASTGHLDVRIETTQRELFAIPWELARLRGSPVPFATQEEIGDVYRSIPSAERATIEEIRFLQTSLVRLMGVQLVEDGFLGPKTQAALADFQRRHGLPADGRYSGQTKGVLKAALNAQGLSGAPVVVVARPSRDRQLQYQRGAFGREGVDAAEIYAQFGCDVHVLENATAASLADKLATLYRRRKVPSICHLAGTITDLHGTLLLDLGAESYSSLDAAPPIGAVMSARELDSVLRVIPDTAPLNPLVIVDVAAPAGPSETARNIVKRNGFAGELFVAGSAPALVAMGPIAGSSGSTLFALLGPLMAGTTLGAACREARSALSSWVDMDNELAIPSLALFAHSPSIGLVSSPATA